MSDTLIPQNSCVLVTGGAGFIGSHTVVELLNSGYEAVIVDDLSNASAKVIDRIKTIVGEENARRLSFYEADVNDADALNHIFDEHTINFVIHFAGFKAVGESVTKPIEYYTNNLGNTLTLLDDLIIDVGDVLDERHVEPAPHEIAADDVEADEDPHVRLRPDGLQLHPHRQSAHLHHLRRHPPLSHVARVRLYVRQ